MRWLISLATRQVTPESLDRQVTQLACFVAAPALFVLGIKAVTQNSSTTGEITTGILGVVCASLLLVVIGLLMPLASGKWRTSN